MINFRGTRGRLRVAVAALAVAMMVVLPVSAQGGETYTEPGGRWSAPLPTNWTAEEIDEDTVLFNSPEGDFKVYILVTEAGDDEEIAAESWARVQPDFDLEYDESDVLVIEDEVLLGEYDAGSLITYADGRGADGAVVQAAMSTYNGVTYVTLIDTNITALQRRAAQFQTLASGFLPTDMAEDDLSDTEIAEFDGAFFDALTAFADDTLVKLEANGVSLAVVRDGEVVYSTGIGQTAEDGAPVTAGTRMMIGSTTKTMTTLLMAQAVDEGVITWDTPVIEVDPNFAVASDEITQQLTMANLVCACTGVPRRDYEMIYNGDLTADDILGQLRTFRFFTDFGEAFQYSNQLVAAGGYETARALDPDTEDLFAAYDAQMQARIFEPVGMTRTTFDFDVVEADADHAIPYGGGLLDAVELPLDAERFLLAVAPAGALWSTADDMGRYLATVSMGGVTPEGERIVSEENLLHTQQPGVAIDANTSYGLGWILGEYKGIPLHSHDGNTLGFSSSMSYMPEQGIGIVVLVNRQGSAIPTLVMQRFYELAFGTEESDAEGLLAYLVAQQEEALAEAEGKFEETIDVEVIEPYLGTFANDVLGTITLAQDEDGTVTYDAGEFVSEVWVSADENTGDITYLLAEPPLAGERVQLTTAEDGTPTITIGVGLTEYVFTQE
jgi:CubicO group peptidase (beta-lactamase class C family)